MVLKLSSSTAESLLTYLWNVMWNEFKFPKVFLHDLHPRKSLSSLLYPHSTNVIYVFEICCLVFTYHADDATLHNNTDKGSYYISPKMYNHTDKLLKLEISTFQAEWWSTYQRYNSKHYKQIVNVWIHQISRYFPCVPIRQIFHIT